MVTLDVNGQKERKRSLSIVSSQIERAIYAKLPTDRANFHREDFVRKKHFFFSFSRQDRLESYIQYLFFV